MTQASWLATVMMLCCIGPAAAEVVVNDAWARATPPGSTVGVVYAQVVAKQSDELVSITSSVAQRAEIHVSTNEGGTMKMRPMATVSLPADKPVRLQPSGMHIMLLGLRAPLQAGTFVELTLRFRSSAPVTVSARVIGPGDPEPAR